MTAALAPWRVYEVEFRWGDETWTSTVSARSRGAALYSRWLDLSDAWDLPFIAFLRAAKARLRDAPGPDADGYAYVRRAYGVDVRIGQRVRFEGEPSLRGLQGVVLHPSKPSTAHVCVAIDGERSHAWVHPLSVRTVEETA